MNYLNSFLVANRAAGIGARGRTKEIGVIETLLLVRALRRLPANSLFTRFIKRFWIDKNLKPSQ